MQNKKLSALGDYDVWNSQKKPHLALRATHVYNLSGKSWLKMSKMVHFGEILKSWSLRSNSVTRHVNFNRQKMVEKAKIENFWMIFKQREMWCLQKAKRFSWLKIWKCTCQSAVHFKLSFSFKKGSRSSHRISAAGFLAVSNNALGHDLGKVLLLCDDLLIVGISIQQHQDPLSFFRT